MTMKQTEDFQAHEEEQAAQERLAACKREMRDAEWECMDAEEAFADAAMAQPNDATLLAVALPLANAIARARRAHIALVAAHKAVTRERRRRR
jgi:hypothetical protein